MTLELNDGFRLDWTSSAASYGQPALISPDGDAFALAEVLFWNGRFWLAWELALELLPDGAAAEGLRRRLRGLPDALAAAELAAALAARADG